MPDSGPIPVAIVDTETAGITATGMISLAGHTISKVVPALRVLTGLETGLVHFINDDETIIGRGANCTLRLANADLSRQHCRILRQGSSFVLEDLKSRNGTQVDGGLVLSPMPLESGTNIRLGNNTLVKFVIESDVELRAAQRLYESAVHDALTNLPNRRHFDERLRAEFSYANRHKAALSLLLLDIDHFKKVNDTRGHAAGDAALRAVAGSLRRSVRVEDLPGRWGGEEFVILARGTGRDGAALLAERIRSTIEKLDVTHEGTGFRVTVSIGSATLEPGHAFANIEAFVEAADQALYRAKGAGRNRVVAA